MTGRQNRRLLKKIDIGWKIYIGIAVGTALLHVAAWSSTAFCDAYIAYVFPVWVSSYGRLMGIFPFSVGEWLIAAGALLLVMAILLAVLWASARVLKWEALLRAARKFFRRFYLFFAWVLLAVWVVMTLNCFILYHASTFSEKYFGEGTGEPIREGEAEYSLEDLLRVRNFVVRQCNRLSAEVERDLNGYVVYHGSVSVTGKVVDLEDKARESMRQLGRDYPQLGGYYPRPKALLCSDFMCQQYMLGWYFPFSMEANYNKTAYIMNQPASLCHELAHLRGYIYEDEANFISYLACVQSDDIYFQYSGYLSVLGYLERDLRAAAKSAPGAFANACGREEPEALLAIVRQDDIFVTDEEWERINKKALLDTEVVDKVTDLFVDTTLKVNGVQDGKVSYSRVVKLLLQYYEQMALDK